MDFAPATLIQNGMNDYAVSYGSDKNVIAEFDYRPIVNEAESAKQGRLVHDNVPFIRMRFAGDKTKIMDRPVIFETNGQYPSDPERFPVQWKQFQNSQKQAPEGTDITEWPPISKAQAMDLKALNIYTVEQLAALPDNALSFLGARQLRDKADAWLKSASGNSEITKLMARLEQLEADNQALRMQLLAPAGEEEEATTEESRPRGRPRKTA